MAEDSKIEIANIAEAPAKAVEATVDAAAETAKTSAKVADKVEKAAKPAPTRRAKRIAKVAMPAKRRIAARKINRAARKTAAAATKGNKTMNSKTNAFAFDAIPAFAPFQSLFSDANDRGQKFVQKGQKVAEELADLTRANVEAIVEAGRVAAEGARSIGQDFVAKGRENADQASNAIRSFAEAKSPTEYLQLQGEFARASFDRFVADSSKLTETMVKLAGEAFQPLQNRASANAERFNTLVA